MQEAICANTALNNGQEETWPLGLFQRLYWFHPTFSSCPCSHFCFLSCISWSFPVPMNHSGCSLINHHSHPLPGKLFPGQVALFAEFLSRVHWGQGMVQGRGQDGSQQNNVWLSWWHVGVKIPSLCQKRTFFLSLVITQTRLLKQD